MSDDSKSTLPVLAALVVGLLALVLVPLGLIWGGYVFQHLWNWFAPPFTSIRLGWAQSVGVCLLVNSLRGFRYRYSQTTDKAWEGGWAVAHVFFTPGLALLVGYIAHSMMGAA